MLNIKKKNIAFFGSIFLTIIMLSPYALFSSDRNVKQDIKKITFRHLTSTDGLSNTFIHCITQDRQGLLLISTGRGISLFNPETDVFANYIVNDGRQGNEFTRGETYKSSKSELFFSSINGLTAFYPKNILKNLHVPPVSIHTVKNNIYRRG
jgi:ligand-binding sensor domain-containing protein